MFVRVIVWTIAGSESLTELMSMIVQRVGDDIDRKHLPRIMVCLHTFFAFKLREAWDLDTFLSRAL